MTPKTTPRSVRNERSLCAWREESAILIASRNLISLLVILTQVCLFLLVASAASSGVSATSLYVPRSSPLHPAPIGDHLRRSPPVIWQESEPSTLRTC